MPGAVFQRHLEAVGDRHRRIIGDDLAGLEGLVSVVGLLGLFYISTFIDLSDKLYKGQVTMSMILSFLWWKTPQFLYYIIAIAVLLAAIVTIGALTRTSELTVMRACGVSLYRTAVPLIALALVGSGLLFAMEERVMAYSNRRADALEDVIRGRPPRTFDVRNRNWTTDTKGFIYYYVFFEPQRQMLTGLSVFETATNPYRLVGHKSASQAIFTNGAWEGRDGWAQRFPAAAHFLLGARD